MGNRLKKNPENVHNESNPYNFQQYIREFEFELQQNTPERFRNEPNSFNFQQYHREREFQRHQVSDPWNIPYSSIIQATVSSNENQNHHNIIPKLIKNETNLKTHSTFDEHDNRIMCILCCDNPADCIIEPCSHKDMCCNCVAELIRREMPCPFCRSSISGKTIVPVTFGSQDSPEIRTNSNSKRRLQNKNEPNNLTNESVDQQYPRNSRSLNLQNYSAATPRLFQDVYSGHITRPLYPSPSRYPLQRPKSRNRSASRTRSSSTSTINIQSNSGIRPRCVICHNRGSNRILGPCGHNNTCGRCAWTLYRQKGKCPDCLKPIRSITLVNDNTQTHPINPFNDRNERTRNQNSLSSNNLAQNVGSRSAIRGRPRCVVCGERGANHILRPCGHNIACGRCAWELRRKSNCPECNVFVRNVERI